MEFSPVTFVAEELVSRELLIDHSLIDGRVVHSCTYSQQRDDTRPLCLTESEFDNILVARRPNYYPRWFSGTVGKLVLGTAISLLVKPIKSIFRFVVVVCLWRLFQFTLVLIGCGSFGLLCWLILFVGMAVGQGFLSTLLVNNFQVSAGSHIVSLLLSVLQLLVMDLVFGFVLYFVFLQWRTMYLDLHLLHLLDVGPEALEAQLLDNETGTELKDVDQGVTSIVLDDDDEDIGIFSKQPSTDGASAPDYDIV
eukprot:CAMPEP_0117439730 /NCGR_PEP_ID=MMETSP0759-20121206/2714_1 /TAXON_ID=63605 /ORGANISM="Percolomonas cosmopolitus, Strain WS" /LENGTH=251 /DNA_ID=CAMNT_0005231451 /DNA_START=1018 /DNA_END=1773 /DNA_ORIENTATION=-